MRRHSIIVLGLLAALSSPAIAKAAPEGPQRRAAPAATVPLTIHTAEGVRKFRVEVARTESEQARGLMFRDRLDANGGMIFPFKPPRPASFWMRNTLIPLDLLFVRADGVIGRIAANAVPYSLDTIDSGEPVAAVVEIAGGRAAALGIRSGDRIRWGG